MCFVSPPIWLRLSEAAEFFKTTKGKKSKKKHEETCIRSRRRLLNLSKEHESVESHNEPTLELPRNGRHDANLRTGGFCLVSTNWSD